MSDTDHLGVWTWRPLSARAPLTTASLNTTTSDVRLGSVAYTSATRRGTKVTVVARSYRYWTSTHAFGPWSGVRGTIEYAVPSQPWRPLKYTYSRGVGVLPAAQACPDASCLERAAAASMAVTKAARTLWSSSWRRAATVVPPGELTCSRSTVGCSWVSRSIVAAP